MGRKKGGGEGREKREAAISRRLAIDYAIGESSRRGTPASLKEGTYIACSFQHLSHNHIMPRTLPLVAIIFAACIGLPQHWGTLAFTIAFFVAALAVLLISAMERSPPCNGTQTCAF
jgi:hypothetical protein